jgi:hypothetical protein
MQKETTQILVTLPSKYQTFRKQVQLLVYEMVTQLIAEG